MKNIKRTLLALMTLTLVVLTASCNKESSSTQTSHDFYDAPAFFAPEPDNSAVQLIDGTLEQPYEIVSESNDVRIFDGRGDKRMGDRKFMPLARILRELQLSEDQRELVKGFLGEYRLCIREAMLELRLKEKEILAPFNEERRAIHEAFKSGLITREEAAAQLKALSLRVREAMKNMDFRIQACEAMKLCMRELFAKIAGILRPEQLVIWDRWIAAHPDKPCDRPVGNGGTGDRP